MDATTALFFSDDSDIGFNVKLCEEATLWDTVHSGMFMAEPDASSREEVDGIVEELRENPAVDFEDGWIAIRRGMVDVTAFLMEKLIQATSDQEYADKQRYQEMRRREEAVEAYSNLKAVLLAALGDKAGEVAAAAA